MSLPFARSERSLQTDDYRTALICSLIALPLFIAWLVWFFAGDLPVRAVSQQLTVGDFDTLVANFTLDEPLTLQSGDAAWLRLQLSGEEHLTTVPAIISEVRARRDGTYDVYLYPTDDSFTASSLSTFTGQAEVDVEARSPFAYLMQLGEEE